MKNLTGFIVIAIIKLLGYLSLSNIQRLGRHVGRLIMARRTRSREVAKVNIQLCYPDFSASEQETFVERSLLQTGMAIAEAGPMWGYSPKKLMGCIREIHNENLLENLLRQKKGILLIAPHLGNWEIINTYIASKHRLTAMYRPAKMPSFDSWMLRRRSAMGGDLLPTTREGINSLFSLLSKGEIVGFLPDQEPKRENGVFVPFMGVDTLTPILPHKMIQATQCNVIYAFAERLPEAQGFDIHFHAALPEQFSTDPLASTAAMNKSIEQLIAVAPEQYQWTYKRFKRRPNDEPNPYKVANVP